MNLYIAHPSTRNNQKTFLAQDHAAGVGTLLVKNTDGFQTNRYGILGLLGFEQAEIIRASTVTSPDTFTLAANTKFPHNGDTKVTYIDWNQVRIYKSTTGINGTYTLVSTLDLAVDADSTLYQETNALSSYYYKFSYYNSFATLESDLSDPIAATGFVFESLKTIEDRILSLFGDTKEEFVTRDEIDDAINDGYEDGQQELALASKRFNLSHFDFTTSPGVQEYNVIPGDFLTEASVRISTDGGQTWPFRAVMKQTDSLGSVIAQGAKYTYWIENGKFMLDDPIPQGNDLVRVVYATVPVRLAAQSDTLIIPWVNASRIFVYYGLAWCYLKDKKFDEYNTIVGRADKMMDKHISFISRISKRHPQYSEQVEKY